MAKRRSSTQSQRKVTRVASPNTNLRLRSPLAKLRLTDFEDRRNFNPQVSYVSTFPSARPSSRIIAKQNRPRRLSPKMQSMRPYLPPRVTLGFAEPRKVLICVRRRIRKNVLHALRKTGKTGQRRPRRNAYSNIHC